MTMLEYFKRTLTEFEQNQLINNHQLTIHNPVHVYKDYNLPHFIRDFFDNDERTFKKSIAAYKLENGVGLRLPTKPLLVKGFHCIVLKISNRFIVIASEIPFTPLTMPEKVELLLPF